MERFEQPNKPFAFDVGPMPLDIEMSCAYQRPVKFVRAHALGVPPEELSVIIGSFMSNDPDLTNSPMTFEGTTVDGRKIRGKMSMDGLGEIEFV